MTSRTQVLCFGLMRGARFALFCWALGLCFAVLLVPARAARAQMSTNTTEQYKQAIEQALLEFRHKNWPESRVLFRRAHALSPSARTLRGMGVVSYEMRDYVQAVSDLDAALSDARQPLNPEQRSEAETLLSRARTFVGVYSVTLEPETAVLLVDGSRAQRATDGTLLLPFGEHTLSASAEGYETGRTQLTVQGGERGELKLALVPVLAGVPAAPLSEVAPVATTAGQPNQSVALDTRDSTGQPARKLRYTWVALGASALFGGASAAFWFLGDNKVDDLAARCETAAQKGSPCTRGKTDTDEIKRYELLTNVSLGLTGAALIATGVLAYIEWPTRDRATDEKRASQKRARKTRVALGVGPSSLSVHGAF